MKLVHTPGSFGPFNRISLDSHHRFDYLLSAALIASPYVLDLGEIRTARRLFVTLGTALSLSRLFSVRTHRKVDFLVGSLVAGAPRFMSYRPLLSRFEYGLHWLYGLGAISLAVLTRRQPSETMRAVA